MEYYDIPNITPDDADEARNYTHRFTLWPKAWKVASRKSFPRLDWKCFPFNEQAYEEIPRKTGIYTFILNPNIAGHCCSYLIYVGITKRTFKERFGEYLAEKTDRRKRRKITWALKHYASDNLFFYCAEVLSENYNLNKLEADLMDAFIPPFNWDFKGVMRGIVRDIR